MKEYKVLFVYNHQFPDKWRDGLYAALEYLNKKSMKITKLNLAQEKLIDDMKNFQEYDFILGWGGLNSPVDNALQLMQQLSVLKAKFGLCLAGNAFSYSGQKYDVIFYETEWTKQWLLDTAKVKHNLNLVWAFGYNSQIYNIHKEWTMPKVIDYLTVGAFAAWKRQDKMLDKKGVRFAIGEIQKDNLSESMGIIGPLLMNGVGVMDMVTPEILAHFYRMSNIIYIPADIYGGGERAVLEAKACGTRVEIEPDNPKLQELVKIDTIDWTEERYASQLESGIKLALAI